VLTADPATIGMIGPTNSAVLPVCPAPAGTLTSGVAGLSLLIASPLGGGLGLLEHSLFTGVLPKVGLRASLDDVLGHVRALARQVKQASDKPPAGADPRALPTPVPAPPPPAPPAPAEQSSGSSISVGSHNHHKGGSSHAVLGGGLLVLYLRPLALARLAGFSGYSRSFRPLALPG